MKKLLLIIASGIALSGCTATLGGLENEFRKVANLPVNNLRIDDFCATVKKDPERYSLASSWNGALYEFTGKITVAQRQGNEYTVGMQKGNDQKLYAKVKSLNGKKIGDIATIQGNISPANFEPSRKQCMMLLDNAELK